MKSEVFKMRKVSKVFLGIAVVCFLLALYACYETGSWPALLPLLPPVILLCIRLRTRYIIWEDGRVEVKNGLDTTKMLDDLRQVIYYPNNKLNCRIRINYRNTFQLLDPEQPLEFLKALKHYVPHVVIEEK